MNYTKWLVHLNAIQKRPHIQHYPHYGTDMGITLYRMTVLSGIYLFSGLVHSFTQRSIVRRVIIGPIIVDIYYIIYETVVYNHVF